MELPAKPIAFVAGATGYTGRSVVGVLARRGTQVVAHVRPDSPVLDRWTTELEGLGARVDTTPWELERMTETLRKLAPTHVFSLLGTTRSRAKAEGMQATEAYERVDYGLTALLIDAVVGSGHCPLFVYLSAVGVREGTTNPYMKARVKAEAKLRASGLRFLVVRPSFISGSDRDESRPLERIGAMATDVALRLVGSIGARRLRDRYRSLTAAELAQGLVRAAFDEDNVGRLLHAEALR